MNEDNQVNNNKEQGSQVSAGQMMHEEIEEKSVGGTIGAIIIVVLLVIGGLYLFRQKSEINTDENAPSPEEILAEPDTVADTLEAQGTSDEIEAIEADIDATNFNNLDIELGNIEAEFGNI